MCWESLSKGFSSFSAPYSKVTLLFDGEFASTSFCFWSSSMADPDLPGQISEQAGTGRCSPKPWAKSQSIRMFVFVKYSYFDCFRVCVYIYKHIYMCISIYMLEVFTDPYIWGPAKTLKEWANNLSIFMKGTLLTFFIHSYCFCRTQRILIIKPQALSRCLQIEVAFSIAQIYNLHVSCGLQGLRMDWVKTLAWTFKVLCDWIFNVL